MATKNLVDRSTGQGGIAGKQVDPREMRDPSPTKATLRGITGQAPVESPNARTDLSFTSPHTEWTLPTGRK